MLQQSIPPKFNIRPSLSSVFACGVGYVVTNPDETISLQPDQIVKSEDPNGFRIYNTIEDAIIDNWDIDDIQVFKCSLLTPGINDNGYTRISIIQEVNFNAVHCRYYYQDSIHNSEKLALWFARNDYRLWELHAHPSVDVRITVASKGIRLSEMLNDSNPKVRSAAQHYLDNLTFWGKICAYWDMW